MSRETSVHIQELESGALCVGYSDYDVEFFGAAEYEVTFSLDKEDADKLRNYLCKKHKKGDLKARLEAEIGGRFSEEKFAKLCDELAISPSRSSWTSM